MFIINFCSDDNKIWLELYKIIELIQLSKWVISSYEFTCMLLVFIIGIRKTDIPNLEFLFGFRLLSDGNEAESALHLPHTTALIKFIIGYDKWLRYSNTVRTGKSFLLFV